MEILLSVGREVATHLLKALLLPLVNGIADKVHRALERLLDPTPARQPSAAAIVLALHHRLHHLRKEMP